MRSSQRSKSAPDQRTPLMKAQQALARAEQGHYSAIGDSDPVVVEISESKTAPVKYSRFKQPQIFQPEKAPKHVIHSVFVYKLINWMVKFWGIPAFVGEATFSLFARVYTAHGATYALQLLGLKIDDLPDNYGDFSSFENFTQFAHPVAEAMGWIATVCEAGNGITLFELGEEARISAEVWDNFSRELSQKGCRATFADWGSNAFSKEHIAKTLYVGTSFATFATASVFTSWGDLEAIETPLRSWLGDAGAYAVMAWLGGGAMLYCAKGFLAKTELGIELLGQVFERAVPYENQFSVRFMFLYEALSTIAYRTFALSFLGKRSGEQLKYGSTTGCVLGGASGLAQGVQTFFPATYVKYFKSVVKPNKLFLIDPNQIFMKAGDLMKPVTQDERNYAREMKYSGMSKKQRALVELKRAFPGYVLPSMGVVLSSVGFYFGCTKSEPLFNQFCSEHVSHGLSCAVGTAAAVALSVPAYRADIFLESNTSATNLIKKGEMPLFNENEESSEMVDPKTFRNAPAAEKKEEAKVETTVEEDMEKARQQDLEKTSEDLERAALPVENQNEEEFEVKPSKCAEFWGTFWSIGSQVTRGFSLFASLVKNPYIGPYASRSDLAVASALMAAPVAKNRHENLCPPSIAALSALGCSRKVPKVSSQGLFGAGTSAGAAGTGASVSVSVAEAGTSAQESLRQRTVSNRTNSHGVEPDRVPSRTTSKNA